jgi:hypothetical protein
MKTDLVPQGTLNKEDFAHFQIVDDPVEVCRLLKDYYRVFGGPITMGECRD